MYKVNEWGVPYSSICFFEKVLNGHTKVKSVIRERDIFFRIETYDNIILNTLLLDEYRFGFATLLEALEDFPDAQYIVYGGKWNRSTGDADKYAEDNEIGIFNYNDFLGAINLKNPLKYIKENDREDKKDPFRSAQ